MKKIVIATNNKGKYSEIKNILKSVHGLSQVEFLSLKDFPSIPPVEEDGKTMQENSIKKAVTVSKLTNLITLADDTGLEVKALNGQPGVYSARFAGPGCTYNDNNKKLIEMMKDVPEEQRAAKFICVITIAKPTGDYYLMEGALRGIITTREQGKNGFGYDPIFLVPQYNKTLAELDFDTKNKSSHRYKAINKSKKILVELINKF